MSILRVIDKTPKRLYAIGDIHGCLKELTILINYLENEVKITEEDLIVFIGDYIDRGPNSKGVISYLIEFKQRFTNTVFLRGNHEDMLIELLGYEGFRSEVYLKYGGLQCLVSYGVMPEHLHEDQNARREAIKSFFPKSHLDFLLGLESYVMAGNYIFAHAGLNLGKALDDQVAADLYWIREPFLSGKHDYGKTIVFGHTHFEEIKLDLPYKIGIDTGLIYGNKLSCVELVEKRVLSVPINGNRVSTKDLE